MQLRTKTFLWIGGLLWSCSSELPVVDEQPGGNAGARAMSASANTAKSPTAKATLSPFNGSTIKGELKFSHFEEGLSTTIDAEGCPDDDLEYSADIREGKSCASEAAIGKELNGGLGVSAGCYDGKAWNNALTSARLTSLSIGDTQGVDIVGHVAVLTEGSSSASPIVACGVIQKQ